MVSIACSMAAACAGRQPGAGPAAALAGAEPEAPTERRLLVRLTSAAAAAGSSPASIVTWASRSAGVPVRYDAAAGAGWHALSLLCRPADCEAASGRLGADAAHVERVEADGLRRAAAR